MNNLGDVYFWNSYAALPHPTGVNGVYSRRIPRRVNMVLFHMQQNKGSRVGVYIYIYPV